MKRTEPDPVPSPVNPRGVKRARRPAAHFLDLDQIDHLLETAWGLAREDRTQYANALRTEVAIFTGLRTGELHNLCPEDIREDGTLAVRMAPNLKMGKPRVTGFVNG
ncbi:MAG TPA: hypothetical protein VNZ52_16920, partial [Candidatus Thermoplasmatota archaeon]|nr:hypothetical protein [Candidatus Thermoplasmatota archaeon]